MRIRRWEEEMEFDQYMRDRTDEESETEGPGRLHAAVAGLGAGLRDAWASATLSMAHSLAVLQAAACGPVLVARR